MDATTDENANGIKRRYESVFEKIDCARREQVDDEKMQRQEKREEHRIKKRMINGFIEHKIQIKTSYFKKFMILLD